MLNLVLVSSQLEACVVVPVEQLVPPLAYLAVQSWPEKIVAFVVDLILGLSICLMLPPEFRRVYF